MINHYIHQKAGYLLQAGWDTESGEYISGNI